LNDAQLQRYARHLLLDEVGVEGQERLLAASVLIVGLGGLGSPAAMYLAASGVGRIMLADGDRVDLTNLQRQIVHKSHSVGMPKVLSARHSLQALNPDPHYELIDHKLEGAALEQAIASVDLVLDCSDNFQTRHAVNRACVSHGVALVSASAIGLDGQCMVLNLNHPKHASRAASQSAWACYHCVFPLDLAPAEVACATMGVFSPLTGMVGCMQAGLAMRVLMKRSLPQVLLMIDGRNMSTSSMRIQADPDCAVCSGQARRVD
jgi:molybdopterin/thiamine biosynthesis adenylyltransferase